MKLVSAVLNSTLSDWLFRITSTNNHLNMYELVALPMPNVDDTASDKIVDRVDAILVAKKADPNADTSALEAEIDDLVFDLYGLTAEEREIVKGSGK